MDETMLAKILSCGVLLCLGLGAISGIMWILWRTFNTGWLARASSITILSALAVLIMLGIFALVWSIPELVKFLIER